MSWIIQQCSRAGCPTAIRVSGGNQEPQPVCKWCHATDRHGSPYAIYDTKLYPRRTDND